MSLLRAFSTLGCPSFSLGEALALASRQGLGGVELRALGGTLDLPAYLAQEHGSPVELAENLRGSAVQIVSLDTSLSLIGATRDGKANLLGFVPWAEGLGVRWLRVFDGGKAGSEAEIGEAVATMQWWREQRRAGGWNVDLMIETHDLLFTAAAINRFLAVVPGAAILWDSHHTWKRGGEDPLVTWPQIREHVVHVHVKDSVSIPSAKHPFTYVLPGQGECPVRPLIDHLKTCGFRGAVSLEWELQCIPTCRRSTMPCGRPAKITGGRRRRGGNPKSEIRMTKRG